MRARYLLPTLALLAATFFSSADAQISNPGVQVQGAVTSGHCPVFVNSGVIQDSGAGCGASGSLPTVPTLNTLFNASGSTAIPTASTITAMIDASLGSTANNFLLRGASTWGLGAFGSEFSLSSSTLHIATNGVTTSMLATTAVTPGSYTNTNLTVGADGRITAASNGSGGAGSVSSVGLALPGIFTVSGSPVTTSGTLTGTLATESANLIWSGPSSGAAAAPTFRALVGADLPNPSATTLGGIESLAAVSSKWINTISTAGVPSATQPACGDLSNAAASCSTDTTNAANISSGALPLARLGTSYTDGQLLIGATSGGQLSAATLTAGSGVTITNAGHSITIASSGSGGVSGPGSSTNGDLACWNGTGGNVLSDCGVQGVPVSIKTSGSPYTVLSTDVYKMLVANTAGAFTMNLAQAGTTGFEANKWFCFADEGAGTLTVSLTTSVMYGALSLVLPTNTSLCLISDGTNYAGQNGQLAVDGATITITNGVLGVPNGGLANAKLANSSITIGGQATALGGSTTNQGNGGKLQLSTGTTTTNDCVKYDANGNTVDAGNACGTVTAVTYGAGSAANNTGGTTTCSSGSCGVFLDASFIPNFLGGLTLSNDGTSPNTVIDTALGAAVSDDNTVIMKTTAVTKNANAAWAVGSGNGCLSSDTGTSLAASTSYTLFLIERTDTSVVDELCANSTSPTLPTNYSKKRRIGSFLTDGSSHIRAFTMVGNVVYWATQTISTTTAGTTASLVSLDVPTGVKVVPLCRWSIQNTSNSVILTSGDETDVAPNTATPFTVAPGWDQLDTTLTAGDQNANCPMLTTNTSGQIRERASGAATTSNFVNRGWID